MLYTRSEGRRGIKLEINLLGIIIIIKGFAYEHVSKFLCNNSLELLSELKLGDKAKTIRKEKKKKNSHKLASYNILQLWHQAVLVTV